MKYSSAHFPSGRQTIIDHFRRMESAALEQPINIQKKNEFFPRKTYKKAYLIRDFL